MEELEALRAGKAVTERRPRGRPVRTGEDRHLFSYQESGARVDLNIVPPSDYRLVMTVVTGSATA
ncbi:hypothetical protein [Streptacidiphilus anmyonensis]|uniref:hypothetical protein n=1 Tax=Streptacidiphilus anmyonensis TaxID=405782 RepID=UPI000AD4B1EC|nr:hypothetical protein [Streptacidiphilus anmyonensis]